jgi:hypothetical protein
LQPAVFIGFLERLTKCRWEGAPVQTVQGVRQVGSNAARGVLSGVLSERVTHSNGVQHCGQVAVALPNFMIANQKFVLI